jgi:hypothetical protein
VATIEVGDEEIRIRRPEYYGFHEGGQNAQWLHTPVAPRTVPKNETARKNKMPLR